MNDENDKFEKPIKFDNHQTCINDDSVENQNKHHNVRKEALGPNTRRKR